MFLDPYREPQRIEVSKEANEPIMRTSSFQGQSKQTSTIRKPKYLIIKEQF